MVKTNPKPLKAEQARESNPKAVFFGSNESIINPLALYLSKRSVDLFTANKLTDAFFGQYFFYVGTEQDVKDFIAQNSKRLPKSLFLFTQVLDEKHIGKRYNQYEKVKIITLNSGEKMTSEKTSQVMSFFLGSSENILTLSSPDIKPDFDRKKDKLLEDETKDHESVSQKVEARPRDLIVKKTTDALIADKDKKEEFSIDKKRKDVRVEQQQPKADLLETKKSLKASEKTQHIKSLFLGSPKGTGVEKKPKSRWRFSLLVGAVIALIVFVAFPFVSLAVELSAAGWYLYQTRQAYNNLNYPVMGKKLDQAQTYFNAAERSLRSIEGLFKITNRPETYHHLMQLVHIGSKFSHAAAKIVETAEDGQQLIKGIYGHDKGVAFGQLLSSIKGNMALADAELGLVEAELKTESMNRFFSTPMMTRFKPQYDLAQKQLPHVRHNIQKAKGILVILPELIGHYGKQTHLVVFQNNMELRPTGGFIGSYGLLTFDEGVLKDFVIEDIYTADGALKGHVDPPEPIRTYLGQEHWYMRDSNWDPDFRVSGSRLAWFLEKEIDVKVNSVLAMDLTMAQYILQAIGPVDMVDFNETISSDNLFVTAEHYSQEDFFPGSTQKKDFLSSLGRTLYQALISKDITSNLKLFQKVNQALDERHLMMFFVDTKAQELVDNFGWSGKLREDNVCGNGCEADFLAVIDANLGVNKVNYYVDQVISDEVVFSSSGQIKHNLLIKYHNNSSKSDKYGGDYKNYVRVYVDRDAELIKASANSLPLAIESSGVASEFSVVVTNTKAYQVFEAWLKVPSGEIKSLALQFKQENQKLATRGQTPYVYQVFNQAGTGSEPLDIQFKFPEDWQVSPIDLSNSNVAGAVSLEKGGQITYNSSLSKDQFIKLQFKH